MIFLLCGQITRQAVRQVVAVPCRTKTFQKGSQIIFHVTPHHLAALDHRVHERVVPGRPLASDVPGVLQAHLYPTHHLLAEVVRQFHVATHTSTLFIAVHSSIAYFRAFLSSSPQPAKSDFRNTSRRSSFLLIMSAVFPRLKALRKSLCELKVPRHPCLGRRYALIYARSSCH